MSVTSGFAGNPVFTTSTEETRLELATTRDRRVRELERQHVSTWSEMAELCQTIEEQGDWKILGFESYGKWLVDAAPQSRSTIYAARGVLKELNEIPKEELKKIPAGNAKILAAVPRSKRSKNLVLEAQARRPAEFTAHVQERHPELHIETAVPRKFKFEASQSSVIDGALLMANIIETGAILEEIDTAAEELLVVICSDYMDRHRRIYERIKNGEGGDA